MSRKGHDAMTTQTSGCNSLKPKKLPNETPPAQSSASRHEPQMDGMEFGARNLNRSMAAVVPSQRCNVGDVTAGKESW
jgi:hypothetical protein